MVLDPNTAKWVHFGHSLYPYYTVHQDDTRRDKYHSRMRRLTDAYKYSPGYLSLILLWRINYVSVTVIYCHRRKNKNRNKDGI